MPSAGLETKIEGCAGTAEVNHGTDSIQMKQEEEEEEGEQEEEDNDDQEEEQEQVEGQEEGECHLSANRRPPHQEQGVLGRRQHTRRKRCGYPGCTKAPSYGEDGGKTVEFCAQHTQQGMVDVVSKGCGYPGCATRPKFGEDGSKKAAFCAQHAQHDMVNVRRASRQFSH